MDNTNNIGSFRSVYMAYGAFKVEPSGAGSGGAAKVNAENSEVPSFLTAMGLAVEKTAGTDETSNNSVKDLQSSSFSQTNVLDGNVSEAPSGFVSYTRIITANIPADIASDMKTGESGSAFDYSGGGQELKITINVSGGSRIYTASGVDKDGNSFSKEIDPYNVDPTDTDYAGFATLCAYIRDTEGMADNAMQAVKDAAPADITESGNYLIKVGVVSTSNGNLSGARKLFEQMQNFFEKLMNLTADNDVKGVSGVNGITVSEVGTADSATEATGTNENGVINLSDKSSSSKNSSYSRIFDELQEMIQLMIQRMLDAIIGTGDTDDAEISQDDKSETIAEADAVTAAENAEKSGITPGITPETEMSDNLTDEDAMKSSLNLENATEL